MADYLLPLLLYSNSDQQRDFLPTMSKPKEAQANTHTHTHTHIHTRARAVQQVLFNHDLNYSKWPGPSFSARGAGIRLVISRSRLDSATKTNTSASLSALQRTRRRRLIHRTARTQANPSNTAHPAWKPREPKKKTTKEKPNNRFLQLEKKSEFILVQPTISFIFLVRIGKYWIWNERNK